MSRSLLYLSMALTALTAIASAGGILIDSIYARETPSWSAQAVGQDAVTLILAAPLLAIVSFEARAGSTRAFLVWLGVLMYLAYSYPLYAFMVHFNAFSPVYIGVLGLSVYLLIFGLARADTAAIKGAFDESTPVRLASGFLWLTAGMFALLWISEIAPAIARGTELKSAVDTGLPSNPVHVLDLAILLPAMAITGVMLRRGTPFGYTLAAPLITCTLLLGIAILGMAAAMAQRGVPEEGAMMGVMGGLVLVELTLLGDYLRHLHAGPSPVEPIRQIADAPGNVKEPYS